jgi:hypothetical protein
MYDIVVKNRNAFEVRDAAAWSRWFLSCQTLPRSSKLCTQSSLLSSVDPKPWSCM